MGESAAVPPSPEPTPAAAPPPRAADATAPADLLPPPSVRARAAWYAGTFLLAAVLIVLGMRLDTVSLRAPFFYDLDSLLILPLVKGTVENGHHWTNPRLGYPEVQHLHDFPVIDHLHFALLWLLSRVMPDVVVLYNVYYLLTYPLCALTGMAVLRELRLTLPAAAVGGLLYAFLPFHHIRWEHHYFLSAYWVVPLSFLPALRIAGGAFPFFRRDDTGALRFRPFTRSAAGYVLLGAATSAAGAYYAFFACALYGVAGAYAAAVFRTWRAAAAAGLVTGTVLAFGVVNHLPTFLYQREHGKNPVTARLPEEADVYGMKFAHLLLPIGDHNLTAFARLNARYRTELRMGFLENEENQSTALGLVGGSGLVGLLVLLVLPMRKGWPYGPLCAFAAFMVLFALMGGLGGVFNLLVFDQIRAWSRISVFLALACFLAVLWPLDRFLLTRTGRARRLRYPVLAAVFALGFFDQTPFSWFRGGIIDATGQEAERFAADRQFFEAVEGAMRPGERVFTLPYIPFPENAPLFRMNTYEPARGYLHTRALVWSYGAMKNREADEWQREAAHAAPDEMLRRVVFRGFEGLFVDTRGYPVGKDGNEGAVRMHRVKEEAKRVGVGLPEVAHKDRQQFFLDLRPYRDRLVAIYGPKGFEEQQARERERVVVLWLDGFRYKEPYQVTHSVRWATGTATAWLVNPSGRDREVVVQMAFGVDFKGTFEVTIGGDTIPQHAPVPGGFVPFADGFPLQKVENPPQGLTHRTYQLRVPPGRHRVVFRCRPPAGFMPADHWPLYYYILGFALKQDP